LIVVYDILGIQNYLQLWHGSNTDTVFFISLLCTLQVRKIVIKEYNAPRPCRVGSMFEKGVVISLFITERQLKLNKNPPTKRNGD
jgi:hypothetical protein